MRDTDRTKQQLTHELAQLRHRVGDFEALQAELGRAKEALRESEEKYRMHFESISDVVFSYDFESRIASVSPSVERMLGYKPEDLIGKRIADLNLLTPESRDRAVSNALRVLAGEKIPFSEYEFIARDGTRRFGEVGSSRLLGKGGKVVAALSVARDTTDRKRAEAILRESEARYRALYEGAPIGYLSVGLDGRILTANRSVADLFGFAQDELIGQPILDLHLGTAKTRARIREIAERIATGRGTWEGEAEIRRKDGRRLWVRLAVRPVLDAGGQVVASAATLADLTERKAAEEKLRQTERYYRWLMEYASEVVIVIGEDGRIRYLSPAAEAVLGHKPDEVMGVESFNFVHPDDLPRVTEQFSQVLQNPGVVVSAEIRAYHKDGSWRIVEAIGHNLLHDPAVKGIIVNYRDITERKSAEQKLQQSERHFRSLIENALEVIIIIGSDGAIRYLSPSVESVLGYEPEEVLGVDSLSFIHPEDLPHVIRQFGKMLRTPGRIELAEVRARHKDGSWRLMEAVGHNLLNDPAVTGIVINYRDITDRKTAENALRESEKRFRTLFEEAAIGMALVDTKGNPLEINSALEKLLGYSQDEMAQTATRVYLHPDDATLDGKLFAELMGGTRDRYQVDKRYVRKDGAIVWGRQTMSLVRGGDGTPLFAIAMVEDVTEKKRASEELERSLLHLRRMLDETVNVVASVVELRDRYTAGHQRRVAALASAIAKELGLPDEQVEGIRMAGLVHDVGKISIPAEILSKPGSLTQIERMLVRGHSLASHEILSGIEFPWPVRDIVLQHHERLDGSGYPKGLSGGGIMLEARIMAVADVVEAMSSHRPYRPALGTDAALAEIRTNKGILYDPEVVEACMKLFAEGGFKFD